MTSCAVHHEATRNVKYMQFSSYATFAYKRGLVNPNGIEPEIFSQLIKYERCITDSEYERMVWWVYRDYPAVALTSRLPSSDFLSLSKLFVFYCVAPCLILTSIHLFYICYSEQKKCLHHVICVFCSFIFIFNVGFALWALRSTCVSRKL